MSRDKMFVRFAAGLFLLLLLYGAGMLATVLWGDEKLASKMLSAFTSMFAGILGLGSGYLLGARIGNDE